METAIFYEVYQKPAILEGIKNRVVLDRDRDIKKARQAARDWGGCVFKIKAEILTKYPLTRKVLTSELVFVHKPRRPGNQKRDTVTRKSLMGKIGRIAGPQRARKR